MLKVDMHKEVLRFLRHECSAANRELFNQALDGVRAAPIESSFARHDPEYSAYMLRAFSFGPYLCVFEFRPADDLIVLRKCRRIDQIRKRPKPNGDKPQAT